MDPLTFAKSYATTHHVIRKGQLYGVLPYTHHLAAVEQVLVQYFVYDPNERIAAWLHDIVEDTDVKIRDVEENFGEEVSNLVWAVTGDPSIDRKARNALVYMKIRDGGIKAIRLKLADRIANMRNAAANGGSMLKKYRKEYPDFRHALYTDLDTTNLCMWHELDKIVEFETK